jgi:hypothetical protein
MIPRPHFVSHSAASKESQRLADTEYEHQRRFREARERARKAAENSGRYTQAGLAELDAKFAAEWIDSHSAAIKQRLSYARERQATYRERIAATGASGPAGITWSADDRREERTIFMAMDAARQSAYCQRILATNDLNRIYSRQSALRRGRCLRTPSQ